MRVCGVFGSCMPGYEAATEDEGSAMHSCLAVATGQYKDVQANTKGIDCPLGGRSEREAAGSVTLCVCAAGQYRNEKTNECTVTLHMQTLNPKP